MRNRRSSPARRSSRNQTRQPAGVALLSTLFMILSISSLGFVLLLFTESGMRLNKTVAAETQAYYAALAGLEEARGRLNVSAPDAISSSLLPQNVNDVLYLVNGSEGDPVDPTDGSSHYFDRQYAAEFVGGISAANLLGLVSSDQPGAGTAFAIPYKWVRITLKTEYSTGQDINRDGVLDNATPVFWDGVSQDLATSIPAGSPVYKLTALAVLRFGIRKLAQVELTGASPLRPAATLATGSSGSLSGNTQTGGGQGQGQGQGQGLGQGLGLGQGPGGPPGLANTVANLIVTGIDACGVQSIPGVATGGAVTTSGTVSIQGSPTPTSEGLLPFPHSPAALIQAWRASAVPILKADPVHVSLSATGSSYQGTDVVLGRAPTATQPAQPLIVYSDQPLTITALAAEGAGILLVKGNLSITGAFTYHGLIVVDGTVTLANDVNGSVLIQGSLVSSGDVSANSSAGQLTFLTLRYDSCSLADSFRALPKTIRVFREL